MQARGYKVDSLFINAKKNFKLRISAARWDSIIKHPRRLFDKQETVEDALFSIKPQWEFPLQRRHQRWYINHTEMCRITVSSTVFLMTLTTQPKSCLANLVKHCATWLLRVRNNIILSSFSPQSVLYIDFGASLSEHLHQSEASSLSAVNTKHKRTNSCFIFSL